MKRIAVLTSEGMKVRIELETGPNHSLTAGEIDLAMDNLTDDIAKAMNNTRYFTPALTRIKRKP